MAPIRDRNADIRDILAQATKGAYEQGWNDCLEAFRRASRGVDEPVPFQMTLAVDGDSFPSRGGRPNTSASAVLKAITENPGLTGAQIALYCATIHERTVRTALRRLRIARKIEQREGKWFAVSSAAAAA